MSTITVAPVVEKPLAEGPDHALCDAVCLRTTKRAEHNFDAKRTGSRNELTAKAGTPVPDKNLRPTIPRCCLHELTPDPEESVGRGQLELRVLALVNGNLLTRCGVLEKQATSFCEGLAKLCD